MAKLNKWAKRKWVRALRSGEYKQGKYRLVAVKGDSFSHCCLGVFVCEMVPEFVKKNADGSIGVDGKIGGIPDDLAILYGLDRGTQSILMGKNDSGQPFAQIADWIEENL